MTARVASAIWRKLTRSTLPGAAASAPMSEAQRQPARNCLVMVALVLVLAGCGGEPEDTGRVPATESSQSGDLSPASSVETVPALGGGQAGTTDATTEAKLTLGELIDRINAGWTDLTRFQETNSFTAGNPNVSGTPLAASPTGQRTGRSIREVILPDQARYVAEENDRLLFEMIVDGDQIYVRGTVAMLLDPAVEPGEWIVTDLDTVASNPMLGEAAASQLGVLTPPRYEIPDRLRPQEVRDLGTTEFEGATCTLYGAADTTSTGNRIDFTFAIDAEDRLCFVQTESVGISSLLVVTELDESAKITPPENARRLIATPVASPASVETPMVPASGTPYP